MFFGERHQLRDSLRIILIDESFTMPHFISFTLHGFFKL